MLIDSIAYRSRWRHLHPAEKAGFSLLALLGVMLADSSTVPMLTLVVMSVATLYGARIKPGAFLRLLAIPTMFLVAGAAGLLLDFSAPAPWLTPERMPDVGRVLARSAGAFTCLLFLALTTPMTDLFVLLRLCRCPVLLLELLTLAYRQIFLLLQIVSEVRQAQTARLGYRTLAGSFRSLGLLIGALLRESLDRSRQLQFALLARGLGEEMPLFTPDFRWSLVAVAAGGIVGGGLLALALLLRA